MLFRILLIRPGVKMKIVLVWPNLNLVPGIRAMDLSAAGGISIKFSVNCIKCSGGSLFFHFFFYCKIGM